MRNGLNSLTTKKQTTKFSSANFQKMLNPSHIIFRIQRANSLDLDEVAHYELPHQDLRCLLIQLFSCLVLTELIERNFRQSLYKTGILIFKRVQNVEIIEFLKQSSRQNYIL